MGKRLLDVVVSGIVLVAISPILGIIALLIRREDGGPVLYSGVRVGHRQRLFRMHKFRTMVIDADKIGGSLTPADDPRLTKIGAKLRQFKLDELPQFWNVLVGDMSLVGPRPQVPSEVVRYTAAERRVLEVRPGITDWASIRFSNEAELLRGWADPEEAYWRHIHPEKIELALRYVDSHSLLTDIQILGATAMVILNKQAEVPIVDNQVEVVIVTKSAEAPVSFVEASS
jgi:lipopolysaccharide/colanic/teichoic acid biosynthesis glycosyltransferase